MGGPGLWPQCSISACHPQSMLYLTLAMRSEFWSSAVMLLTPFIPLFPLSCNGSFDCYGYCDYSFSTLSAMFLLPKPLLLQCTLDY